MAFQKQKKMTLLCETGNIRFDRFFNRKKKPSAVLKLSGDHPLPLVPHLISNNTHLQVLKSLVLQSVVEGVLSVISSHVMGFSGYRSAVDLLP